MELARSEAEDIVEMSVERGVPEMKLSEYHRIVGDWESARADLTKARTEELKVTRPTSARDEGARTPGSADERDERDKGSTRVEMRGDEPSRAGDQAPRSRLRGAVERRAARAEASEGVDSFHVRKAREQGIARVREIAREEVREETVEGWREKAKEERGILRKFDVVAERETERLTEEENKEREARFLQQDRRETIEPKAAKRAASSQRSARSARSQRGTNAKRTESHDRSRSPGGRNTEDPVRPDGTTIRHKWGMVVVNLLLCSPLKVTGQHKVRVKPGQPCGPNRAEYANEAEAQWISGSNPRSNPDMWEHTLGGHSQFLANCFGCLMLAHKADMLTAWSMPPAKKHGSGSWWLTLRGRSRSRLLEQCARSVCST